jgi:MFS family permease
VATSLWDFFTYRFFCGMGVGGFFAAGVTMLAETMPDKARPKTLGLLQVVAAACNMCACALAAVCGVLELMGFFQQFPLWRCLFVIGFIPAALAYIIMRHLQEPEAWKKAIAEGGVKKAGSIPDLFRHPRWRYNVILGMCLATCGVIGLWGIAFFSGDLTRMAFRNIKNAEARERGDVEKLDFELIRMLANNHTEYLPIVMGEKPTTQGATVRLTQHYFIGYGSIYQVVSVIGKEAKSLDDKSILAGFDELTKKSIEKLWWQSAKDRVAADRAKERKLLAGTEDTEGMLTKIFSAAQEPQNAETSQEDKAKFEELASKIAERATAIRGHVTFWGSIALLLFNFGAIIGTWVITVVAERWGRRLAFTTFFAASFVMTVVVFLYMGTGTLLGNPKTEVLVLTPILGFCVLSIFGGYAIYFPELFPTRLRSTAISFCYNIARFAAATGPAGLGLLTAFYAGLSSQMDSVDAFRYAGATMSATFILAIIFTWMGPETKGKPLPEE